MTIFPGARWITALDLDFTAQSSQTLNANQNYTIGGLTWTKINTANEASATVLTNGTGLVFTPASTSDQVNGTQSLPAITTSITSIIPNLTIDTPLRLWTYISADNPAANFDSAVFIIENSTLWVWTIKKGFFNSSNGWLTTTTIGSTLVAQNQNASLSTNKVALLTLPTGIVGPNMEAHSGTWSGQWPSLSAMTPMQRFLQTTSQNLDVNMGSPSNFSILLGAQRAGSATSYSCTFARIRLDFLGP